MYIGVMLQTFLFGIDQIESTSAVTLHVTLEAQRFGMILGTEDAEPKTLINPLNLLNLISRASRGPIAYLLNEHVLIVNKRRMDKRSFDEELTELNKKVTKLTLGEIDAIRKLKSIDMWSSHLEENKTNMIFSVTNVGLETKKAAVVETEKVAVAHVRNSCGCGTTHVRKTCGCGTTHVRKMNSCSQDMRMRNNSCSQDMQMRNNSCSQDMRMRTTHADTDEFATQDRQVRMMRMRMSSQLIRIRMSSQLKTGSDDADADKFATHADTDEFATQDRFG
ncbi:hypothetical protein LXL04_020095 [Taraxacum kok-saghyz]